MFLKIISLTLISLFISCGKSNPNTKNNNPEVPEYSPLFVDSHPEFDIYVTEFLHQYSVMKGVGYNKEIPAINFYDLDELPYLSNLAINVSKHFNNAGSSMAGVCLSYPSGKREILIDPEIWEQIESGVSCSDNCFKRKQALIFHELGHCVLNRDHRDDKYRNYNLSIMNSILIRQSDVLRWEESYFYELFTSNTSDIMNDIDFFLDN